MRWISKGLIIAVVIGLVAFGVVEMRHYLRFKHFVGYGLHTDVVLGNSDIGTDDMYYAVLWNLSVRPVEVEGCFEASDVVGFPDSVLDRWDVQKKDLTTQQWVSLRGADTWVETQFDGSMGQKNCRLVMTQIRPFHGLKVAWVYKDWVTTGEPVRMAIYTSAWLPPENQKIIYTDLFVVKAPAAKKR